MIREYIAVFFLISGFFFLVVAVVGLLRLPDIYTRMHSTGKCDTLGTGLLLIGLMLLILDITNIAKLFLIGLMISTINPVITHVIAKEAYNRGTPMVEGSFLINDYVASQKRRRKHRLEPTTVNKGSEES